MPENNRMPQSEEDFLRMQQEAILRVREMQQRARRTLEAAGMQMEPDGRETVRQQNAPADPISRPNEEPRPQTESRRQPQPGPQGRAPNRQPSQRTPSAAPGGFPPASLLDSLLGSSLTGAAHPPQRTPPRPARPEPPPPAPAPLFEFAFDKDQLIILGVLFMLWQDKGDPWLMLALVYLLLP